LISSSRPDVIKSKIPKNDKIIFRRKLYLYSTKIHQIILEKNTNQISQSIIFPANRIFATDNLSIRKISNITYQKRTTLSL